VDLEAFARDLDRLQEEAEAAFARAADGDTLEIARVEFLGAKSGRLKQAQKSLSLVDREAKPEAGRIARGSPTAGPRRRRST